MLVHDREEYVAGVFPWQLPLDDHPPTDHEIVQAIAECIAERGRHLGRDELWLLVRDKFPGEEIPRKRVAGLRPKLPGGRPPKI
jgi:hypothetical protein